MGANHLVTLFLIGAAIVLTNCQRPTTRSPHNRSLYDYFSHRYLLNRDLDYNLEWKVSWSTRTITFNITAATRGYIGFGLSKTYSMSGADLVIAGVNGSSVTQYIYDMHGSLKEKGVEMDDSQDYELISASENSTHTNVMFSRILRTCDTENDLEINDDSVFILYAVGETDDLNMYHFGRRGAFPIYLLDPDYSPTDLHNVMENERSVPDKEQLCSSDLEMWTVSRNQLVPPRNTAYICSLHKGPELNQVHHIVGYKLRWEVHAIKHIHHMVLLRCTPAPGKDPNEVFGPFASRGDAEMCYFLMRGEDGGLPTQYCREVVANYVIGQKTLFFPPNTGIPIGHSQHEYYLIQIHYDNPDVSDKLNFTMNFDVFYTKKEVSKKAGILSMGHNIPGSPSLLIPPYSLAHLIRGHCGPECLTDMIPDKGIKLFATQLHTHDVGVGVKLRLFRGNTELPWITGDKNYNNQYQAVRFLRPERRIMKGDHLMLECTYDSTTKKGGGVVVGGFSRKEEMCVAYLWYYHKINFTSCRSEIQDWRYSETALEVGKGNWSWSDDNMEYLFQGERENDKDNGLTVSSLGNRKIWNLEERTELQRMQKEDEQVNSCKRVGGNGGGGGNDGIKLVKFPKGVKEWDGWRSSECDGNKEKLKINEPRT